MFMDLHTYKKVLFLMLEDTQEKLREKDQHQYRNDKVKNVGASETHDRESMDPVVTVFR